VHTFYAKQHKFQTLEKVKELRCKYDVLSHGKFNVEYALNMLDDYVDPSDPDISMPNSYHAYQTAENIRKQYPENKMLQIIGLIHDLGKILFKFEESEYFVVGDTYVLGCDFPENIIFRETLKECPDWTNPLLRTKFGIYEMNCGIENLYLSYGHDEYLYQVLYKNKTSHKIENKYLDIIRFHSFYPFHTGGEYRHLMSEKDYDILADVQMFNNFDLYSKTDVNFVVTEEIKKYYQNLLLEFFPTDLKW
jgi:inositol oxygenase